MNRRLYGLAVVGTIAGWFWAWPALLMQENETSHDSRFCSSASIQHLELVPIKRRLVRVADVFRAQCA